MLAELARERFRVVAKQATPSKADGLRGTPLQAAAGGSYRTQSSTRLDPYALVAAFPHEDDICGSRTVHSRHGDHVDSPPTNRARHPRRPAVPERTLRRTADPRRDAVRRQVRALRPLLARSPPDPRPPTPLDRQPIAPPLPASRLAPPPRVGVPQGFLTHRFSGGSCDPQRSVVVGSVRELCIPESTFDRREADAMAGDLRAGLESTQTCMQVRACLS